MARQPFFGRGQGPQIARMDMNVATAPGRAYGQMFANLGKIAGDSIEKYAEGKKKKEEQKQTASFIKRALMNSPETAAQLGITATDSVTFKEAVDQSSNAIAKDPKGLETVKGFVEMANERLKAQQDKELFKLRKEQYETSAEDRERLLKEAEENQQKQIGLSNFLMSGTEMNPKVLEDFNQAQPGLFALGGNDGTRNRFLEYQRDTAPKVGKLGGELESSEFASKAMEAGVDPVLAGNYFMKLQKAEQTVAKENTGKLGDQFSSRVGALQPYYFSESDATNAVSNEATKLGINLNKDQLAQAVSKQKVIPTKDLRSAADTRFSKLNLDEPRTILEAADDLESFLDEGGVLSGKVAKEKLARMVQPAGILTEDDLRRMGTSSAFMDSLNTLLEEKKTGKIDKTLEGYLRNTTKVFRQRAQEVLKEKTDYTVNSLANNFGITPEEVRKYTQFGGIMYGFDQPSNQESQQGQPPQDPSLPQVSTLPGGGIFTPIAP